MSELQNHCANDVMSLQTTCCYFIPALIPLLRPNPPLIMLILIAHYQPISSLLFVQPPSAIWQPPKPADVQFLSSIKI